MSYFRTTHGLGGRYYTGIREDVVGASRETGGGHIVFNMPLLEVIIVGIGWQIISEVGE